MRGLTSKIFLTGIGAAVIAARRIRAVQRTGEKYIEVLRKTPANWQSLFAAQAAQALDETLQRLQIATREEVESLRAEIQSLKNVVEEKGVRPE